MVNTQRLARAAMDKATEDARRGKIDPVDMGTTLSGAPKFTRRMDGADGGQPVRAPVKREPKGAFE